MGVVIRRWVWLETIGVVSGCFPHNLYIATALVSALFCSSSIKYNYYSFAITAVACCPIY